MANSLRNLNCISVTMAQYSTKCFLLLCALVAAVLTGVRSQSVDLERDARLTTPELLHAYNYPAETHSVTTDDGYILEMHRVPNPGRPAVLLMHGMLSSSADFVLMGPQIALAYFLFDEGDNGGYDSLSGEFCN